MKAFTPPSKAAGSRANAIQRVSQPTKSIIDNRPTATAQRKLQIQANGRFGKSPLVGTIQRMPMSDAIKITAQQKQLIATHFGQNKVDYVINKVPTLAALGVHMKALIDAFNKYKGLKDKVDNPPLTGATQKDKDACAEALSDYNAVKAQSVSMIESGESGPVFMVSSTLTQAAPAPQPVQVQPVQPDPDVPAFPIRDDRNSHAGFTSHDNKSKVTSGGLLAFVQTNKGKFCYDRERSNDRFLCFAYKLGSHKDDGSPWYITLSFDMQNGKGEVDHFGPFGAITAARLDGFC